MAEAAPLPAVEASAPLDMRRVLSLLSAGSIVGVLEIALAASYAALVFSGPLQRHLPSALGMVIVGAAIVAACVALMGSTPGVIGAAQNIPAAVLAAVAASVLIEIPGNGARTFATVGLALAASAGIAGIVFLVLGFFKLGNLVRFIPYPVIGGFIAGSGWLLLMGALGVLTGTSRSVTELPELLSADLLTRWLPELAFVGIVIVAARRSTSYLLVPGALLAGTVLFYVVLAVQGTPIAEARDAGLLLGPFPDQGLFGAWTGSWLGDADISVLFGELPAVASLTLAALLQLLLNASGMELILERDADLNRELRAAGAANLMIGATGGIAGYQSLSLTTLAARVARPDRSVGVVAAAFCVVVLFFGKPVLALFPRAALGGLLMFVGLSLLIEWIYEARLKMPPAEYGIVVLITAVMAITSFLPGVLVGLVAATVLFVVNYSRQKVVKHALSGANHRSHVERPAHEMKTLRKEGGSIHVLELQGFLFFGTSHALFEQIRARLGDAELPKMRFLILDFRRVDGLDSSAILSFAKTVRLARSSGFALVITGLKKRIHRQLERGGIGAGANEPVRFYPDLDHGLQWCEDQLLEGEPASAGSDEMAAIWDRVGGEGLDRDALMRYLERIELPAGTRLITQGERSREVFFLAAGHLTALLEHERGHDIRLRTMMPGTVVGEVGVYLGDVRSASVVAEEPCIVFRLSDEAMARMEGESPSLAAALHRSLARLLAERLVDLTASVDELRD